jgi:hypothetical protein
MKVEVNYQVHKNMKNYEKVIDKEKNKVFDVSLFYIIKFEIEL